MKIQNWKPHNLDCQMKESHLHRGLLGSWLSTGGCWSQKRPLRILLWHGPAPSGGHCPSRSLAPLSITGHVVSPQLSLVSSTEASSQTFPDSQVIEAQAAPFPTTTTISPGFYLSSTYYYPILSCLCIYFFMYWKGFFLILHVYSFTSYVWMCMTFTL
jgi:hypothetical protein